VIWIENVSLLTVTDVLQMFDQLKVDASRGTVLSLFGLHTAIFMNLNCFRSQTQTLLFADNFDDFI
jgi:hypothetical protein